jgi:hypothetical protein
MAARRLKSVPPGRPPEPVRKLNVAQAAATGDHRQLLVAMRERIARTVADPDCPPRDLAALTRRLQDIAREIEGIDARAAEEGEHGGPVEDESFDASSV